MKDLVPQNARDGDGFNWRLRLPKDQPSDRAIVLELADSAETIHASIFLSAETLWELLRPYIWSEVDMQLDGAVALESQLLADLKVPPTETDILQLVSRAIAPEMLEDEPDAKLMLSKFRDRLLKSLELVEQAIASLPQD